MNKRRGLQAASSEDFVIFNEQVPKDRRIPEE